MRVLKQKIILIKKTHIYLVFKNNAQSIVINYIDIYEDFLPKEWKIVVYNCVCNIKEKTQPWMMFCFLKNNFPFPI